MNVKDNPELLKWLTETEAGRMVTFHGAIEMVQIAFEAGQQHAPAPTVAMDIARVVMATIKWVDDTGECHFCDYSQYGHQGHGADCVVGKLTPESRAACEAATTCWSA